MTPDQRLLARHALGLPNDRRQSYRNRYYTSPGHPMRGAWQALADAGMATITKGQGDGRRLDLFALTRFGALQALDKGERLDMEDFPEPVRLRLSRAKGFNLQALSQATNGLPAVNVARPSKWGNPFDHSNSGEVHPAMRFACEVMPLRDATPLRGYNLACWCALTAQCHADILLDAAAAKGQP